MTELCRHFRYSFKKKGQKICTAGDKDDTLYLILRGKIALGVPRKDFPSKIQSVRLFDNGTDRLKS